MKSKYQTPLEIYNKRANKYDTSAQHMESFVSKEKLIFKYLQGKILEVGTGTGSNLQYYNTSASVYASDWSPKMVEIAKEKVKELNLKNIVEIKVADIQKLDQYYPPHSFDFVTSRCVFCSVPDPLLGLRKIAEVLKPNGKLIQIEHGLGIIGLINLGLKLLDPLVSKNFGLHIDRNHIDNLRKVGYTILYQKALEPTKIFRLIISKISR